jgi:hypothetical protein
MYIIHSTPLLLNQHNGDDAAQARLYITAYGFQHLMCWLKSRDAGRQVVCAVYRLFFDSASTLSAENQTICSNIQPCAPEDGRNDARNMLS